jgi:hypothetical protein
MKISDNVLDFILQNLQFKLVRNCVSTNLKKIGNNLKGITHFGVWYFVFLNIIIFIVCWI